MQGSFAYIRVSVAHIRDSFAYIRVFFAYIRGFFAHIRVSFAYLRDSFVHLFCIGAFFFFPSQMCIYIGFVCICAGLVGTYNCCRARLHV